MQTRLELSHWAANRDKPAPNGHTCDWKLEVKGDNLQLYIERIVFNLHPTFPQPKKGSDVLILNLIFRHH